ncbi:MAG: hypothetical protein ABSG81_15310 [Acidimicrobiales bacterium]|jgi:bifunctional DNA-binding transcriptional regulator/antitoxin component of YhaV-PrlF toxin-antitoxin module
MAAIHVTGGDGAYRVEVRDGERRTVHEVTVPAGLAEGLGWDPSRTTELVEASFAFLLEREPASSILRRFRLDVIGDYFPDYGDVISRRAGPSSG